MLKWYLIHISIYDTWSMPNLFMGSFGLGSVFEDAAFRVGFIGYLGVGISLFETSFITFNILSEFLKVSWTSGVCEASAHLVTSSRIYYVSRNRNTFCHLLLTLCSLRRRWVQCVFEEYGMDFVTLSIYLNRHDFFVTIIRIDLPSIIESKFL